MRQHGNHRWSGHREITRAAVRLLFADHAGPDGRIRGLDEQKYADGLDHAQARKDRALGAGLVHHFAGTSLTVPYAGFGPTMHSACANPDAQREHFMADPYRSGPDNLRTNIQHLYDELDAARRTGGAEVTRAELAHLGAAAHALEDSFSSAHCWREDSLYDGDVAAPVRSFNVFTPAHAIGIDDGRNTHSDAFDKPPAGSGSARAAVEATYRMLRAHETGYATGPEQAGVAMRATLAPMVRPSSHGVTVNLAPDRAWRAERDRRLALERRAANPMPSGELNRLGSLLADQPPPARPGRASARSDTVLDASTPRTGGRPREDPTVADDCLFCKIVAGSIPSDLVLENDSCIAFRDINPQAPVHVVVVPKDHHPDLAGVAAADPELTARLAATLAEVAAHELLTDYRVVFNTGAGAGQSVFHVHGHVLGGRPLTWPPG